MCGMNLTEYIKKIGRDRAAKVFEVTPGAISHWLNGIRNPSRTTAKRIVERTHGLVTYEGIFGVFSPPITKDISKNGKRKGNLS